MLVRCIHVGLAGVGVDQTASPGVLDLPRAWPGRLRARPGSGVLASTPPSDDEARTVSRRAVRRPSRETKKSMSGRNRSASVGPSVGVSRSGSVCRGEPTGTKTGSKATGKLAVHRDASASRWAVALDGRLRERIASWAQVACGGVVGGALGLSSCQLIRDGVSATGSRSRGHRPCPGIAANGSARRAAVCGRRCPSASTVMDWLPRRTVVVMVRSIGAASRLADRRWAGQTAKGRD